MNTEIASLIEQYLQSIHRLVSDVGAEEARSDLLQLIDQCVVASEPDPTTQAFFLAEQAFYHRQYKTALQRYLPLSQIPLHPFFCYRASAFLLASLGQQDKALDYAKRALIFQHHDLETLRLCQELASPTEKRNGHKTGLNEQTLMARIFEEDKQETLADVAPTPSDDARQEHRPSAGWNVVGFSASGEGYYLHWNGFGIVINPGKQFLDQGPPLNRIDCVIVTSSQPDHEAGVQAIGIAPRDDGRHIHYYLSPHTYHAVGQELKPSSSPTAEGVLHALNVLPNSSDTVSLALSEWVTLHYFTHGTEFGIRLTLERYSSEPRGTSKAIEVGYLLGSLAICSQVQHLQRCDLIIAGINDPITPQIANDLRQ